MDLCSAMTRSDVGLLKHVVGGATHAKFGLGLSRDDDRSRKVVEEAVSSPWFDYPLEEVKAAVVIYSSSDPWQKEADDICSQLVSKLPSATIAFGSYADSALKDRTRLSLVICR